MNIGVTTLYAHRTIVHFAEYLNTLLQMDGHTVSALVCDSSLPMCHSRLAKGTSRLFECSMCVAGGLRSFPFNRYHGIDRNRSAQDLSDVEADSMVASSVYTIERVETIADLQSVRIGSEKRKLHAAVRIVYQNTLDWIKRESLDMVFCYNGRMDITRAVLEACKDSETKFVSFERPWNGFGIQLVADENCMSLTSRVKINEKYADKPLTRGQANRALKLAAMRVSQSSVTEWRTYGDSAKSHSADKQTGRQNVLLLPSSRSEFLGAPDFDLPWGDFTQALDSLLKNLPTAREDVALKAHPVWQQDISKKTGRHIFEHYRVWAEQNGIHFLRSSDARDTNQLIEAAEIVVVGGSTAGVDAALAGKKVILLGRAVYEGAGFVYQVKTDADFGVLERLDNHDPVATRRAALRFLYTSTFRIPYFSDCVTPLTFFEYQYAYPDPGKPEWMSILRNGGSWDDEFADDETDEDDAISRWMTESLDSIDVRGLFGNSTSSEPKQDLAVRRRLIYRGLDKLRRYLPRGDKMRGRNAG